MHTVITTYVKTMVGEKIQSLNSKDGRYQPMHKFSILLADLLKKSEPEKWKESAGFSILPIFLRSQLETISASKLTADQLAKLPRKSILVYSQFLTSLAQIRGIILLYVSVMEDDKPPLVTAENIHDQLIAIKRFFEQAAKLRLGLVQSGAATHSDATILLQMQVTHYSEQLSQKLRDLPQLEAAFAEAGAEAARSMSKNAEKV